MFPFLWVFYAHSPYQILHTIEENSIHSILEKDRLGPVHKAVFRILCISKEAQRFRLYFSRFDIRVQNQLADFTHLFCVFSYTYAPFARFFATQKAPNRVPFVLQWKWSDEAAEPERIAERSRTDRKIDVSDSFNSTQTWKKLLKNPAEYDILKLPKFDLEKEK